MTALLQELCGQLLASRDDSGSLVVVLRYVAFQRTAHHLTVISQAAWRCLQRTSIH